MSPYSPISPRRQVEVKTFLKGIKPEDYDCTNIIELCEIKNEVRGWAFGSLSDTIGKALVRRCIEKEAQLNERFEELMAERSHARELVEASAADETADPQLSAALERAIKMLVVKGFVYLKRWGLPDGTCWYKIGITNNPSRREAEQNVLPVPAETLELIDVGSMDKAQAIEQAIHGALDTQRIRNAQNRELFSLNDQQLASLRKALKELL